MHLPSTPKLPIQHLASAFDNTTNSYKFYWFWAILDLLKEGDERSEIPIKDLLIKMVALSWHTVNYYKLSLGILDKISRSIKEIIELTDLTENSTKKEIETALTSSNNKQIHKTLDDLGKYVPFRFIRPFFANQLSGEKNVENKIKELASECFEVNEKAPTYKFGKQSIILHDEWKTYFITNLRILEGFCLWNLVSYLQSRNPNVSNIGNKLLAPDTKRDLKNAKTFWNIAMSHREVHCIYSHTLMNNNEISIDHFVPWSFVTHDLLWNLSPTTSEINSSKSNNLPNIHAYLYDFSKLQYQAFQTVYQHSGNRKLLEDYSLIFQDELDNIFSYRPITFEEKLKAQITPLIQIATNLGFQSNWILK